MRVLATTLALVASTAAAQIVAAPEPVGAGSTPAASPGQAAPKPAPRPALAPVVPTQALLEKLAQGDRLSLAGDHRSALFVYQDAVYLQPRYPPARVRLGRAYLALRYPAQAIAQAEAALAEDAESAEARTLLEDARAAAARASGTVGGAAAAPAGDAPPPKTGPRVFKITPEPGSSGPSVGAGGGAPVIVAAPVPRPEDLSAAGSDSPGATGPQAELAAQRYRTALEHLQNREFAKAVAELSDAILADPKLAVAYSARGSAQFGLGKYREAAEDYRTAILLDGNLGTPVYGLAECYRVLGDGKKAAEMYDRYARSTASDVREDLRTTAAKRAEELR